MASVREQARQAALAADTTTVVELADVVSDVWEEHMAPMLEELRSLRQYRENLLSVANSLFPEGG